MDNLQNAKTENTPRRQYDGERQGIKTGLGRVQGNGCTAGTRPIRVNSQDHPGQDYPWGYTYDSDTPIGKILERLELVEKSHFANVRTQKARLEARLKELIEEDELFRRSLEALRQEIYTLATAENTEESQDNREGQSSESS